MKAMAMANGTTSPKATKSIWLTPRYLSTVFFSGAGGCRLAVSVGGSADQPPVILLHGAGQTRYAWKSTTEQLVRAGFHAFAPDIRGHGDSDWAADGDYCLNTLSADLQCLIKPTTPPTLIGASLGGHISLATVGLLSDSNFDSLVLVDIANTINPDGIKKITTFMNSNRHGFASLEEAADSIANYLPHRPRPSCVKWSATQSAMARWTILLALDLKLFDTLDAFPDISPARYDAAAAQTRLPTLLVRGGQRTHPRRRHRAPAVD